MMHCKRIRVSFQYLIVAIFCIGSLYSDEAIIIPFADFGLEWSTNEDQYRKVEVWRTSDNGEHWALIESMSNPTSPIKLKAQPDGQYGFYTRATTFDGKEESLPQKNTLPKVNVIIDTQSPEVIVKKSIVDKMMMVEWKATDLNLDDQCCSIHHFVSQQQILKVDDKNLAATGNVSLAISGHQSYILTVSDRAGNTKVKVLTP